MDEDLEAPQSKQRHVSHRGLGKRSRNYGAVLSFWQKTADAELWQHQKEKHRSYFKESSQTQEKSKHRSTSKIFVKRRTGNGIDTLDMNTPDILAEEDTKTHKTQVLIYPLN